MHQEPTGSTADSCSSGVCRAAGTLPAVSSIISPTPPAIG